MVLRNAFGDLALDATLQSVLAQLDDATADTVLSVLKALHADIQTNALTNTELRASAVGVTITNPTADPETGLAKESTLASVLSQLDDATADTVLSVLKALLVEVQGTLTVDTGLTTQTDALTDAQLRATAVKVDDDAAQALLTQIDVVLDSIDISLSDPATETTLTALLAQLNDATADTVLSVLKAVLIQLQGTLTVDTGLTTQTDALTDAQLRATPVTVATPGLTNAELRASPVGVADAEARATLADVKRSVTDFETRLDYDIRVDGNPVYVGKATQGTLTTATEWTIQRMEYDGTNRLTRVQVLSGAIWDNRATLGWT